MGYDFSESGFGLLSISQKIAMVPQYWMEVHGNEDRLMVKQCCGASFKYYQQALKR